MKTIYKANGKTFNSLTDVEDYSKKNNWEITDTEEFIYKDTTVVSVNLKSIDLTPVEKFTSGLTELENKVLTFICIELADWRDDEPGYSCTDGSDITKHFGWNPKTTSGVISSLCKKGLLDSDEELNILYPQWDSIPNEYGRKWS